MNGNNWILVKVLDVDLGGTVRVHVYCFASALVINLAAWYDITIAAATQTRLQVDIHCVIVIVDGNERSVASRESDLIVSIVPPVSDLFKTGHISKFHHVCNLSPTVFTNPSIAACVVTEEIN